MKVASFKVNDDFFDLLEEFSRKRNIPKSVVIRQALEKYIMADDKDKPFVTKRIKIYT